MRAEASVSLAQSSCPIASEQLRVHVSGFLEEVCVAGDFGDYVLRVAVDGEPVVPTQTVNDGPTVFGG